MDISYIYKENLQKNTETFLPFFDRFNQSILMEELVHYYWQSGKEKLNRCLRSQGVFLHSYMIPSIPI